MAVPGRRGPRGAGKDPGAPHPTPTAVRAGVGAAFELDCLHADYIAEARLGSDLPTPSAPEIAFAGRSNVGKSTLINCLCQRKGLARTSRTPGCTRGVVLFDVRLRGGEQFILADLPGYGFAERSKSERGGWGGLIESYLQRRAALAGVVILVDVRRGIEPEEEQLMVYLRHVHRRFVVAVTKVDKLTKSQRNDAIESIARAAAAPAVGVSGEIGDGREDLLRRILAMVRFAPDAVPGRDGPLSPPSGI